MIPLAVVVMAVVALVCASASSSRAQTILAGWAAREGLTIHSAERCWILGGPFWWRKSDSQVVFRICATDSSGRVLRGHARCGGRFAGLWSDEVTVVWD